MPKDIGRTTIAAYRQQSGKCEKKKRQLTQQLFDAKQKESECGERFFEKLKEQLGGESEAISALTAWHKRTGNCAYHVRFNDTFRDTNDPVRCQICCGKIVYDRRD
jgi:hypothetical protein